MRNYYISLLKEPIYDIDATLPLAQFNYVP